MIKITNFTQLILVSLTLVTSTSFLQAQASGQSRVESYLKNADLNDDGKIEPHEMTGPIKRYLGGKGYDITEQVRIKDVIEQPTKKKEPTVPVESNLKVPKFGVAPTEKTGIRTFSTAPEPVKHSESVNKKTRELFERYDRDGNNILDENEIKRMNWGSPRPSTNDKNGDGQLSFSEIQGRYSDRETAERRRDRSSSGESRRDDGDDRRYGDGDRRYGDGDRDRRRGRFDRFSEGSKPESSSTRKTSTSRNSTSSSSSPYDAEQQRRERSENYVDNFFSERDKDGNGILEDGELDDVRSKRKYDTNKDGKVDKDEMLNVIMPPKKSTSSNTSSSKNRSSSSRYGSRSSSTRTSGDFNKKDANEDKLIQMHEYSKDKKWTEKKLNEFLKKDKNGDGVISPDEW